jgi:hypothetical protein
MEKIKMGKTYGGILPKRGVARFRAAQIKPFQACGVSPQMEIILVDFIRTLEKIG